MLSILGQAKTGAVFTGIDKQKELVELAIRSAALNGQKITFQHLDISETRKAFAAECFDAVVFNPPYFTEGQTAPDFRRAASRHADSSLLTLFLENASYLLKNRGDVYFCYPAEKMPRCFHEMRRFRLEPKILQLVANKQGGNPRLLLLKGKKNAGEGLIVEPVRTYADLVLPENGSSD